MADLPIMLRIADRLCVIVGGGSVALRRTRALLACGARIRVVAPVVHEELAALDVAILRREYQAGDLRGARLVIAATDDPKVNDRVAGDVFAMQGSSGVESGEVNDAPVLFNQADRPEAGDLTIPAHHHLNIADHTITLAVSTDGASPAAAAAILQSLVDDLDEDWAQLLQHVAGYRERAKEVIPDADQRRDILRRLASSEAMDRMKQGGVGALKKFCDKLLAEKADG